MKKDHNFHFPCRHIAGGVGGYRCHACVAQADSGTLGRFLALTKMFPQEVTGRVHQPKSLRSLHGRAFHFGVWLRLCIPTRMATTDADKNRHTHKQFFQTRDDDDDLDLWIVSCRRITAGGAPLRIQLNEKRVTMHGLHSNFRVSVNIFFRFSSLPPSQSIVTHPLCISVPNLTNTKKTHLICCCLFLQDLTAGAFVKL